MAKVQGTMRNEEIQTFLRGPEKEYRLAGCFRGIRHARKLTIGGTGFSLARPTAHGKGAESYVMLKKKEIPPNQNRLEIREVAAALGRLEGVFSHLQMPVEPFTAHMCPPRPLTNSVGDDSGKEDVKISETAPSSNASFPFE